MNATNVSGGGRGDALAVTQVAGAGLLGLLVLPAVLGPGQLGGPATGDSLAFQELAWLAGAGLLAIWLIIPAPALARAIDRRLRPLARVDELSPGISGQATTAFARWLTVIGYVALATGTINTPLVIVLAAYANAGAVQAAVSATTLLLLLAAMFRLHTAATPVIETIVLRALDALVPTVDSPPADVVTPRASAVRTPGAGSAISKPSSAPVPASVIAAAAAPTQRMALPNAAAAATLADGAGVANAAQATQAATNPGVEQDATIGGAPASGNDPLIAPAEADATAHGIGDPESTQAPDAASDQSKTLPESPATPRASTAA